MHSQRVLSDTEYKLVYLNSCLSKKARKHNEIIDLLRFHVKIKQNVFDGLFFLQCDVIYCNEKRLLW